MENIIFLKPNNLKDIIEDKDKGAFIITFDIKDIKLSIRFISKDIINISYYRDKLIKNVYVDVYEKNFNKDFKLKLIKKNGNYCISNGYLDVIIHCDPFFYQIAKSDEIVFKQAIDDKDITSKRYSDLFTFILNGNQIVAIKDSFYTGSYENFYGFGEKFSPLNKRGYNIEALNYDACGVASDKSYKNVPFFLNTKGYGILIDTTSKIKYNLATISFDSYSIEVEDSILDYYFFYGPSFKYILSNYIKLTGKLEDVPPKWSFGLWMSRYGYRSRKEIEMIGDELRKKEIPADVISLDPFWLRNGYYCDFVFDESKFPHPREMISSMRDKGFKLRIWIQPTVSIKTEMFKEGKEKGYLLKNINGDVYLWQNPISNEPEGFGSVDFSKIDISKLGIQPKAGIVDFTNPEAVSWFLSKLKYLIDWGVGIIMCDFGEDIPEDAYFFNGKTGKEMRNAYSYLYSGSVYNFMKKTRKEKPICEIRSGWAGMQKYAIHWSGDPKVSFDAMREVLRGGLSLALSGVFFWSHDIAGTAPTIPESELYIRWAQFGMFTSHARCHGMYPKEPWHYGKKAEEIFRRYDKLRYSLIPYIYSCAHHCIRENVPFIRPLVLENQEDPISQSIDDEYFFGSSFLVAPVFNKEKYRYVYLPKGRWVDYWTKIIYEGEKIYKYYADIKIIPLFVKSDSIIPMQESVSYIKNEPIKKIILDIYPDNKSSFKYIDDFEEINFSYLIDDNNLDIILGNTNKNYEIIVNNFKNNVVKVNGIKIKDRDIKNIKNKIIITLNKI